MLQNFVREASEHGDSELKRIDFLDGWRGLAIALVLASHFLPVSGIELGRMGVDVFFVLSGILMANILYVKRVPLKTFYKRRISRIFPVFILFVSFIYGLGFFLNLSGESSNVLYTLAFLRTYLPGEPDIWNTGLPVGHLWSLNVEEHCYILLSAITLIALAKGREYLLLIAMGMGTILLHVVYLKVPGLTTENFELRTEIAASHLLLASGYFLIKHNFERFIPSWLPVVTFALALFCYHSAAPWYASWMFSPFLLAFTVNHLNLLPKAMLSVLEFNPLRLLGLWSYSIYLWQQPLYFYWSKGGESFNLIDPLLLIVSIAVGAGSFYIFENPVRRYINNRW